MIRIFIGKDDVETVAYHALCESIISRSSVPVSITPVYLNNFKSFYNRDRDEKQSNDFSFSRFLVPYLCEFNGHAIFMDCDMLARCDIAELWAKRDHYTSLQVVKHEYTPKDDFKYLGNKQYKYEKKNWSSVILWNCGHYHTRLLTPDKVESMSGLELHQFKWTEPERIGQLDKEWNWLVDEYDYNENAKIVHFTRGGPWFLAYENSEYSDEWFKERARMNHVA